MAFSHDGLSLAVSDISGSFTIWDVGTGRLIAAFSGPGGKADCVAFSPDGKRLITGHRDATRFACGIAPRRSNWPFSKDMRSG